MENKQLSEMTNEELYALLQNKLYDNEILEKNENLAKAYDSPHEIVFTVTANVLEANEKGEIVGTTEICSKNYHIPVAVDKDYNIHMNAFFDRIENCIVHSMHKQETKENE